MQGRTFALVCAGAFCLSDCGGKSREVLPRPDEGDAGASTSAGGEAGTQTCSGCSGAGSGGEAGSAPAGAGGAGENGLGGESSGAGATGGTAGEGRAGEDTGTSGASGEGASSGAGGGGASPGASGEGAGGGAGPSDTLAIRSIAAYQTVEVALASGDEVVEDRNAPVIAGRGLMLRVFVAPASDFTPRELVGRLSFVAAGANRAIESRLTVSGASVPAELESTFVFQLEAADVTTDLAWSLAIEEADGSVVTRFPESGSVPLGASEESGVLEVTLVPLVANGITPDLSPPTFERYLKYMRAAFPVADVFATVREAVTLEFPVDGDGTGLSEALDRLYEVRAADAPADNVYFYGVLTPAASMDLYCADGCTVGLASIANPNQVYYRGGIGTGFFENVKDTNSQETLVHELGHAMGRPHSPCGTDSGGFFPYEDGSIGVWGYDGNLLRSPNRFADVMGYCLPVWISDYTFLKLFERIAHVNATALPRRLGGGEGHRYRRLIVGPEGALSWGGEIMIADASSVSSLELTLTSSAAPDAERVRVGFSPFDHLPGGFALVPAELLVPGVRVALGGASIEAP